MPIAARQVEIYRKPRAIGHISLQINVKQRRSVYE
jgi:hypothetical protein